MRHLSQHADVFYSKQLVEWQLVLRSACSRICSRRPSGWHREKNAAKTSRDRGRNRITILGLAFQPHGLLEHPGEDRCGVRNTQANRDSHTHTHTLSGCQVLAVLLREFQLQAAAKTTPSVSSRRCGLIVVLQDGLFSQKIC